MQIKPKSNSTITHSLSVTPEGTSELTFTVRGAGAMSLNMASLSREVLERAALHGMIQRISDAAALGRDPDTGLPATPESKAARMQRLIDHYSSGTTEWAVRTAEGGPRQAGGLTLRAVAAIQGVDVAVMQERLARLAEKKSTTVRTLLAELAKGEAVKLKMAELAPKVKKSVNVDSLLNELTGEQDGDEGDEPSDDEIPF